VKRRDFGYDGVSRSIFNMDSNLSYIQLSNVQVGVAAALIVVNGAVSIALRLGMGKLLLLAAVRTVVQLTLIGFVLQWVFAIDRWYVVLALLAVMTVIAGVSAVRRTEHRYAGIYANSLVMVWASSWAMAAVAVSLILTDAGRWYEPQYSIPLLGMILGNSLNGVSLGLNSFTQQLVDRRDQVELRLALGATRWEAAHGVVRQAVRTGMIPTINSMMVVGIVSLPGMMTGQLLAGVAPIDAVKYQIVIMFLIASATAAGTAGVVMLGYRRLFNRRHQFLFDRLTSTED